MEAVQQLLRSSPELALFVCLALGYALGNIKLGPFQLGGVCGTLLIALLVGQTGVRLDPDIKNIAFALFIFALGFVGGPQFFSNVAKGWRLGIFSAIEIVTIVGMVLLAATMFHLDRGTAAGLLAGSATESAVVGTASEAIARLKLPAEEITRLQANVVTAYSVTYVVGLIVIILFTSQIAPMLMRIDLKKESQRLWQSLGGDGTETPGQVAALPALVGRLYRYDHTDGATVEDIERKLKYRATIERVLRGEAALTIEPELRLREGDRVLLIGRREGFLETEELLGTELPASTGAEFRLEEREVFLTNHEVFHRTLSEVRQMAGTSLSRGVYLSGIERMGKQLPVLQNIELQRGDVVKLYGASTDVARAIKYLGSVITRTDKTDFVYLGLGISIGILIGKITFTIAGVPMSLGTGVGALLAGLFFGWAHTRHPTFGNFPSAAAELLKDFGLATFIAAIGLSAGPQAFTLIRQFGIALPLTGVALVLVPACISLFVGRYLLHVEPPILLGAIAGQQSSTPAISAVQAAANSSIPLLGYTVTYAISNVLLPLTGPLVIGILGRMGAP